MTGTITAARPGAMRSPLTTGQYSLGNEVALKIRAVGYTEGFLRSWRLYLDICTAAFTTGRTEVVHVELRHA